MNKAISYWSFPGGLDGSKPHAEAFAQAKKAGFQAVEVALSLTGEVSLDSADADLARVKKSAWDTGIEIASLACALHFQWPFTSDDSRIRSKAADIARKAISTANALGTDALLTVSGAVDVLWDPSIPVVQYADAHKRASDAISALIPDAKAAGVAICVENVWNKMLLGPMEMAAFVDQFDSPWV
ncbi:MAG: sugar phosphate isomerase/epimerase, partial [Armatimonadetes bacterium]|nr:sugar phosphate isomerase/epimerase [Armatimonadota bacterium]